MGEDPKWVKRHKEPLIIITQIFGHLTADNRHFLDGFWPKIVSQRLEIHCQPPVVNRYYMQCPKCLRSDTKVLDSRVATDGYAIRRRRECSKCKFRFSTVEQMEILDLVVVKRNGSREPYSKDKLVEGLRRALEKRPITQDNFKKLVASMEQAISNSTAGSEITSTEIGEIVMKQLKRIDQVAYIRFASVYRQFKDIEEFRKELKKL